MSYATRARPAPKEPIGSRGGVWATELHNLLEGPHQAARENECVGIAVLDRARLRLLTKFLGQLREHVAEEFDHRAVRHTKTVGMNSLGAASHAHQRADEQVRLNLQQVIHEIDLLVARQSVRHLVLAGSTDIVAKLKTSLPKRLASLVIGTADIATNATVDQIMSVVDSLTRNFLGERENATVMPGASAHFCEREPAFGK